MAISIRHPIRAKIDDRASFLHYLLHEYPNFLADWEKEEEVRIREQAKECADGDKDIENSEYIQGLRKFDTNECRLNLFYQAVFIMTFSCYESAISAICKKEKIKECSIKRVYEEKVLAMSDEMLNNLKYISLIKNLRNFIVHNNMQFPSEEKEKKLKEIDEKWDSIHYEGNDVTITDSCFVNDAIDKIHQVLSELCSVLNYKNYII